MSLKINNLLDSKTETAREKKGGIFGGQRHQVIENTCRKNVREMPCQDVHENTGV
jgi:hypothetical protein